MEKKLFEIENKKTFYFAIVILAYELLYWIITVLTKGNLICAYFHPFLDYTFMDYFSMLANMQYDTPYIYHSNYPAMCFLFWKIMYGMIPSMGKIVDGFFLRNYMPAQLGYILFTTLTIIMIWELLNSFKIGNKLENRLFSCAILLSGPMIFTFERGNIIILAFLFLLIFIRFYNSDKSGLRLFAYICLAISASLKLYPALFGILVIKKKRYKEAALLVFFGLLFFFVPFFAFDGIQSIKDMLKGMSSASSFSSNAGLGINFSFNNLLLICCRFCNIEISYIPSVYKVFPLIFCIAVYALTMKQWQKIFIISLLCIWIPDFSYTYMLILFIIPFIFYLKEEQNVGTLFSNIYGIFFSIIMIPMFLPFLEPFGSAHFPLTLSVVIINMAILILSIVIFFDSVKERCKIKNTAIL